MGDRIAHVDPRKCKPWKCSLECKSSSPVVRSGQKCIQVDNSFKNAEISKELCVGCSLCVKSCPFGAIKMVRLPTHLGKDVSHAFRGFHLYKLPVPRIGHVLGLVGGSGLGKSTCLRILAGKLKPNLGRLNEDAPSWAEVLNHFRSSGLGEFLTQVVENRLITVLKPEVIQFKRVFRGKTVRMLLESMGERGVMEQICDSLDLNRVLNNNVENLSPGELQSFAIAAAMSKKAQVYLFDEVSTYLDAKKRLQVSQMIRSLLSSKSYVVVVDHDLSLIDYLSDFVCCLYGKPGAYGVVTLPFTVKEGINIFLDGFIPTENLRFRDESLTFKVSENQQESDGEVKPNARHSYPSISLRLRDFELQVEGGDLADSEIVVLLGENGSGKSTLLRMFASRLASYRSPFLGYKFSLKPQSLIPRDEGTVVRQLLEEEIRDSYLRPQFVMDVMKPLGIEELLDQAVGRLSGGELQRVAITVCLGKDADIYLIDEPSAYLDSEQRIAASKAIKLFIQNAKKPACIVEHDLVMATYLADRVIVYEGLPGVKCMAHSPQPLLSGMNLFLSLLNMTFRRDSTNFRPRINKLESTLDKEQKAAGSYYYYLDD